MEFDWSRGAPTLENFGGSHMTLHVPKTGLPFFDVLQLYGATDLYFGLREDTTIHDAGKEWLVRGRSRTHRLAGRDVSALAQIRKNKKPDRQEYCDNVRHSLLSGGSADGSVSVDGRGDWDAALQDGIRGVSARAYDTLQTGQTSKQECKAAIPLFQALFAFAGKKRTEGIGDVTFLPVFEGRVDLSKVVCPVRTFLRPPHVLCSQALVLLALQTSLFYEGYPRALRGVVFNTEFDSRKHANYSGLVTIDSTAVGRLLSADFANHVYRTFLALVRKAWERGGRTTKFYPRALSMTYWLMQPVGKHLTAMVSSQEAMHRENLQQMFTRPDYVKEVFGMTYQNWSGDHDAVRAFARAVASGINWARGRDSAGNWLPPDEQRKNWYDEVTLLRSAPNARAFRERALILIEQGHRENSGVGTVHRDEAFDPQALLSSIGDERGPAFEAFRDLFRMYLVQASTYQVRDAAITDADDHEANGEAGEQEKTV